MILRHASAEAGDGTQQSASFVVDMSIVFEDFVGTALREAMAAYPGEMRLRYNALLNEAVRDSDRIVVQPGAVDLLGGRPVIVYDAKYQAAADAGRHLSGTTIRMLAYCTSLRVPTAWLVYPGAGEINLRRILNPDIDVVEFPLDRRGRRSKSWFPWRTSRSSRGAKWWVRQPSAADVPPGEWSPGEFRLPGCLFHGHGQQVAQESLFRLARVVGDVPAELLPDLCPLGLGVGENRIDDRGYLPAQGVEIGFDLGGLGGPPVLLRPGIGRRLRGRVPVLSGVVDLSKCGIWRSPVE